MSTTNETKHTPLPWRANGPVITAQGDMAVIVANVRCQLDPICRPDSAAKTFAERDANAAFIVRACNAHEELVQALTDAADMLRLMGVDMKSHEMTRNINAALAKAKGGAA